MRLDPDALAADVVRLVKAALAPVTARLAALEARPTSKDGEPGPAGARGQDGPPGAAGERGPDGPAGTPGRDGRDGLPGVPGVPGEKGLDGKDGLHGKDGLDGFGFDDLSVLHDGARLLTFRFQQGTRVKDFAVTIPAVIYRGVYADGKTYDQGDTTTWAGSLWHCNEPTTTKPGDGSKAWTLTVKRGRDGKDGQDAPSLPVVKVR